MHFKGEAYLVHFALPNFYFHATTAYAILRRFGVEIGKRDFLGMLRRAGQAVVPELSEPRSRNAINRPAPKPPICAM